MFLKACSNMRRLKRRKLKGEVGVAAVIPPFGLKFERGVVGVFFRWSDPEHNPIFPSAVARQSISMRFRGKEKEGIFLEHKFIASFGENDEDEAMP